MKYYTFNNRFAYVLIACSSVSLALWVSLVAVHAINSQLFNIEQNSLFSLSIASCSYTYPLTSSSTINPANLVSASFTNAQLIYTSYMFGYHDIYQKLTIAFLILNGVCSISALIASVLLLLRSRSPYKEACYLHSEQGLKTGANILGFACLLSCVVYWGHTLSFFTNMKKTPCNNLIIYSASYQSQSIIGGIMLLFSACFYFLTLGIRKNRFMVNKNAVSPIKQQQYTKQNLLTIEASAEAQRIIAQRLASLPKINQLKPIGMIESRQPSEFMFSETEDLKSYHPRSSNMLNNYQLMKPLSSQQNNVSSQNTISNNNTQYRKPFSHDKGLGDIYTPLGRVRKVVANPVEIEEIEIGIDERLQMLRAKEQERLVREAKERERQREKEKEKEKQKAREKLSVMNNIEEVPEIEERILDELDRQPEFKTPSKQRPSSKKQRLKLFMNRSPSPVSELKRQWGYT